MSIPNELPSEVKYGEIENFEDLETRVSAIDSLFANIIGVNEDFVEWCPNEDPPSRQEYLAWAWLVRPSLGKEIQLESSSALSRLITAYDSKQMDEWFEYIAT
jgi:hypothetical protein